MATNIDMQAILRFVDQTQTGVNSALGGLKGLKTIVDAVGASMVVMGAKKAAAYALELGELGAESVRARTAFTALEGSSYRAEKAMKALTAATGNEISQAELAKISTRLLTDGLVSSQEEMVRIAAAADRIADTMGLSAAGGMEALISVLETRSPRALRGLGLDVAAVEQRIKDLTASGTDMTEQQVYMAAVLQEVETRMRGVGGAAIEEAAAIDRAKAKMADLKAEAGEYMLPMLADVLDALVKEVDYIPRVSAALDEQAQKALTSAGSYEEYMRMLRAAVKEQGGLIFIGNEVTRWSGGQVKANYALSESEYAAQKAIQAFIDTGGSAPGMLYDIAASAGAAADGMGALVGQTQTYFELLDSKAASAAQRLEGYSMWNAARQALDVTPNAAARIAGQSAAGLQGSPAGVQWQLPAALRGQLSETRGAVDGIISEMGKIPPVKKVEVQGNLEEAATQAQILVGSLNQLKSTYTARVNMTAGATPTYGPPGFASGTPFAAGGWALVGEQGPELLNLPRGTAVVPNDQLCEAPNRIIEATRRRPTEEEIARSTEGAMYLRSTMQSWGALSEKPLLLVSGSKPGVTNNYNYNLAGDTVHVSDASAMAALREAHYRARMRTLNARM